MNKKTAKKIVKKKKKMGRPTKYQNIYCALLVQHFSGPEFEKYIKSERITIKKNGTKETWYEYGYRCTNLPTFAGFARKIKVNQETVSLWATEKYPDDYVDKKLAKKLKHPNFSVAYNTAKELQKEFLSNNALKGFSPPASFIFIAKNITDMKDKQEIDHTTKGKEIKGFNYLPPEQPKDDGKNSTDNKAVL